MSLTIGKFLQGVFGGSSSESRSASGPIQSQIEAYNSYFPLLAQAYNAGDFGRVTPFNQWQMAGQNMGLNFANQFGNTYGGVQDALNRALSGNVNLDAYNPVADAITQRMTQAFNEGTVPALRRNSLGAAGRQTSRLGDVTLPNAAQSFQRDLGQTLNQLYLPAYQQAQQNMMGGLSLSPSIAQLGLLPSSIYQDIGGQRQALHSQYLNQPYSALAMFSGLLGNPVMQSSSSSNMLNTNNGWAGLPSSVGFGPFSMSR